MDKKPSERILDIYYESRGSSFDQAELMDAAIVKYLDEEWEREKKEREKNGEEGMTPLEINKLIAELKGFKGISISIGDKGRPTGRISYEIKREGDTVVNSNFYNWAENISDAWELFEESTEPYLKKMPPNYECVMRDKSLNIVGQARAGTPAKAICLAWIKWKESK